MEEPIGPVPKADRVMKVWPVITGTIALIISITSITIKFTSKIELQRLEIDYLKSADKDKSLMLRDVQQQVVNEIKEVNNKLTNIQIALQNKVDKK